MTTVHDVLELVRAPAALTVVGDSLAGQAAGGTRLTLASLPVIGTSVLLYSAGMALNDWADTDLDRVERPERPIPSGRVSPGQALALAAGLTVGGIGLAAVAGPRRLIAALPLAALVWTYDLVAKPTALGPPVMAGCRAADVLLGAAGSGAGLRRAVPAATLVGSHTLAVTLLSRGEVHGSRPAVPAAAALVTGAVAAAATATGTKAVSTVLGAALAAGAYLATVLPAQVTAVANPSGPAVRAATRAGISGMIPLQAALAAAAGRWGSAATLGGALAAARALAARRRRGDTT